MNYKIIGNDGKIYGPASAEQIRAWIAQGRVESRTPIFCEGAGDWTFVGLLPEFAQNFNPTPPPLTALKPDGASSPTNKLAVWSLICGILAWTCCCCCVPFNLVGLILGIIALAQIQSQPEKQEGRIMAIVGLVLSATNLLWSFGFTLFNLASQPRVIWNFTN